MFRKIVKLMVLGLFVVLLSLNISANFPLSQKDSRVINEFDVNAYLGFKPSHIAPDFDLSGYTNLSDNQILIDDRNPELNWSRTAADNDWCSGSGTWNDPYVIENVLIDGKFNFTVIDTPDWWKCPWTQNCISIYFSTAYFIIRNCFLTCSGTMSTPTRAGIFLYYAENGLITNNIIVYCREGMILWGGSNNITVDYNGILNNIDLYGYSEAIDNQGADNFTCTRNVVINTGSGIKLRRTGDNRVEKNLLNNTLYDHPVTGIHLKEVNDSIIVENVLAGSFSRISVFYINSTGSFQNVIYDNTIQGTLPDIDVPSLSTSGTFDALVSLEDSHRNTIARNVFYIPGYVSPEEIPGYELFTLVISISVSVFAISIVILISKRKPKSFL